MAGLFRTVTGAYGHTTEAFGHIGNISKNLDTIDHQPTELLDEALRALNALVNPIRELRFIPSDLVDKAICTLKKIRTFEHSDQIFTQADPTAIQTLLEHLNRLERSLESWQRTPYGAEKFNYETLSEELGNALKTLEIEWRKQSGVVQRGITAIAKGVHQEWERFSSTSSSAFVIDISPEAIASQHPLLQLSYLMYRLDVMRDRTLSDTAEDQLWTAINAFDSYSEIFKGIEARLKEEFRGKKLFENLDGLYVSLSLYLIKKIQETPPSHEETADNRLYEAIYQMGCEQNLIEAEQTTLNGKATQGFRLIEQYERETPSLLTDEKAKKTFHGIWVCVAQHEEQLRIDDLYQSISNASCISPEEFFSNLEYAIAFFEKSPQFFLPAEKLEATKRKLRDWCSYANRWVEDNIPYAKREQYKEKISEVLRLAQLNNFSGAVQLMRTTFEKSPMGLIRWPATRTASPLPILDQTIETFSGIELPYQAEHKVTRENIHAERLRLIKNMSYYLSFESFARACGLSSEEAKPIFHAAMAEARKEDAEKMQQDRFFSYLSTLLNTDETLKTLSPFWKIFAKTAVIWTHFAVSVIGNSFSKDLIDYLQDNIILKARGRLSDIHLMPIDGGTRALKAYKSTMDEWMGGKVQGTREEALNEIAKKPEYSRGHQPNRISQLTGTIAVDQFLFPIKFCGSLEVWRGRISDYTQAPILEDLPSTHPINKFGNYFKGFFSLAPYLGVELVHLVLKILELGLNSTIKTGVKWFIKRDKLIQNLAMQANDSLSKKAYLLEIILEQLKEIEKSQDTEEAVGDAELIDHELPTTKDRLGEMVQLLFEVTDQDQYLSSASMANRPFDNIPFLDEHTRTLINKAFDDNLRNAFVTLMIVISQSLLTEDHMNRLLHKILQKGTTFFKHEDNSLTREEDQDLARELHKSVEALNEVDREPRVRRKHAETMEKIHASLEQIVSKSVAPVIDRTIDRLKMSPSRALMECIDWMEKRFFQTDRNIFKNLQHRLQTFKEGIDEGAKNKILAQMHQDYLIFLKQFKGHQALLDRNPTHNIKMLNQLNNNFMPLFLQIEEALRAFFGNPRKENLDRCCSIINQCQSRLEREFKPVLLNVKRAEESSIREERQGAVGKLRQGVVQAIELTAPGIAEGITTVATEKLKKRSAGMIDLLRNRVLVRLTLDHQMLLFVEKHGYGKV